MGGWDVPRGRDRFYPMKDPVSFLSFPPHGFDADEVETHFSF